METWPKPSGHEAHAGQTARRNFVWQAVTCVDTSRCDRRRGQRKGRLYGDTAVSLAVPNNTRVWLTDLSRSLGRNATLDDVADAELDGIARMGFDWVWLLSVWQTGPVAQQISRANPEWRHEFQETLHDLQDDDIAGSGFAITGYTVHAGLGGDKALGRIRERLRRRGEARGTAATRLNWTSAEALEGVVQFGDLRIHVCLPDVMANKPSSAKDFLVVKLPSMVEKIAALTHDLRPRNIFELGIFKGGSVVLYNEIFKPRKLVAVGLGSAPLPHLEEYIRGTSVEKNVSIQLGVNQADRRRLSEICAQEFGGEALDLVIDDASHFLFETRESFRELFPRLRPGGVYVIEDWGWAHWTGDLWQRDQGGDEFRGKKPMTNLIMELAVLAASKPDCVNQVSIEAATVYVTRGVARLEPGFELSDYYLNRGNPLPRFS